MKKRIPILLVGIAILLMASLGQAWTRTGGDLGSRVAALEVQQALNTAAIAQNASDIADNASDIADNAADIATNASAIATNASAIATNASGIATNASAIATNASGIATNASGIAGNASSISSHVGNTTTAHSYDARYVRDSGENLRVIRGRVDASGTITSGSGFTVTKGGTGVYTVNYASSFSSIATPVVSSTFRNVWNGGSRGAGSFTVNFVDSTDGSASDGAFTFVVVGTQ